MRVADIVQVKGSAVTTVHSWTAPAAAIELLTGPPPIGALVVGDDGHGHVNGIVTERDVIRALRRDGTALLDSTVADVMVHHVPTCTPDDLVSGVMAAMTRSRNRHLPVVEGGVLCGLVSIGDVVRHRLDEMLLETDVLP